MLQVEIGLDLQHGLLILPAGLPGYAPARSKALKETGVGPCVMLDIPELQLHFRMHDFYMGKQISCSQVALSAYSVLSKNSPLMSAPSTGTLSRTV